MITFNSLDNFVMVYAISQQAITDQFQIMAADGVLPSKYSYTDEDNGTTLDIDFGIPSIDLSSMDSASRQAILVLRLAKATMTYYDIDYTAKPPQVIEQIVDISNSSLRLITDLDTTAVTDKQGNTIPSDVQQSLQAFDESKFNITSIFMNLENVYLISNWSFVPPPNGDPSLTSSQFFNMVIGTFLENYAKSLQESGNPYVLGYTATSTENVSASTSEVWTPTGVNYSTFPDAGHTNRSSLNYLLVTCGAAVPGNNYGLFNANWITSDDIPGTFIISEQLIMGEVVLPKVASALGTSLNNFSRTNNSEYVISAPNDMGGTTKATITPNLGQNTISIKFHGTFTQDVEDHLGTNIGTASGTIDWTTIITFAVDSKNDTINVTTVNQPENPQAVVTDEDLNWIGEIEKIGGDILDGLLKVVTFGFVDDVFGDMSQEDWDVSVSTNLTNELASVKQSIILPGGSDLIFKDVTFNYNTDYGVYMKLTATIQN